MALVHARSRGLRHRARGARCLAEGVIPGALSGRSHTLVLHVDIKRRRGRHLVELALAALLSLVVLALDPLLDTVELVFALVFAFVVLVHARVLQLRHVN